MIPRRRNLKGVLAGFLGTYTSRYSDYQGFWLFGFIVGLPNPLEIDLLGVQENALSPEDMAGDLARVKFREQLRKHGFELSAVRRARLVIEHGEHKVGRLAGDFRREGFDTVFRAFVVADTESRFDRREVVFVAPHDERFERRSARHPGPLLPAPPAAGRRGRG